MNEKREIADMLLTVTRMMVDEPDEVSVEVVELPHNVVYKLRVAPSDQGKLIGPGKRTERSLRNVLMMAGMKRNLNLILDIAE